MNLVAAAVLPESAEELSRHEVAVLVEVFEALRSRESILSVDELLVALVLELLVPVEQVVGAGDVLGVMGAFAAAADRVEDLQLP